MINFFLLSLPIFAVIGVPQKFSLPTTKVTQGAHMVAAVEIADFLRREFPQTRCVVEAVGDGTSTVSHEITVHELRPGGTVSGPVLMSVADVALYVAIFGKLGIIPLAVTTSFT